MSVRPDSPHRLEHDGVLYLFCRAGCLAKFRAEPGLYLAPAAPAAETSPPGTRYTCPMHPEIIRDRPGDCPICGMALEPTAPSLEEKENPELTDMRRRFWVCLGLTLPLLVLVMTEMIVGHALSMGLDPSVIAWLQLVLATPVVLWGGRPFFVRGWASIVRRSPNMFTLISLGVGAAYVYSVAAALFPSIFPGSF